jgi:sucrose-phosphate synthase
VTAAPRLLATDLDGTFIGDDAAALALWADLDAAEVIVAFATGRHLRSMLEFCEKLGTSRRPRACVAMVGTEIWLRLDDDDYELDQRWANHIGRSWSTATIDELTLGIRGLERQPDEWQSSLKRSFFVPPGGDEVVSEVDGLVGAAGLDVKLVYSDNRFLDLLPARSGKGAAVRFLADELGVQPVNVVTAGDTGNDLDMMQPDLGFRSIIVGNATAELATFDGPHVVHARASFASGVREGLERHGWLPS